MVVGPILLFFIFYIPAELFGVFGGTAFVIMLVGIPIVTVGACIVALSSFLFGFAVVCKRLGIPHYRLCPPTLLAVMVTVVVFWGIQIPSGPDKCSDAAVLEEYTSCLERHLSGMSESEVRTWLQQRGYTLSSNYDVGRDASTFSSEHYSDLPVGHYFMARRSYGRPHSLPYGNNFKRWLIPVYPAPDTFKLGVGVDKTADKYHIYRDTAIEL